LIGHFLTLSAFLDSTNVGEDLFRSHLASTDKSPQWMEHFISRGIWDRYKYRDILVGLRRLSLLQSLDIGSAKSHFSLHPLVTDWLRLRVDQKSREKYAIEATTVLKNYINTQYQDTIPLQIKLDMLSHVDICVQNDKEYLRGLDESDIASLRESATTLASFYQNHCRYQEAEAMYERALAGCEKALGPDHTSTLNTVNSLGNLYSDQGRLAEAEAMYERQQAGTRKARAPDHTTTPSP